MLLSQHLVFRLMRLILMVSTLVICLVSIKVFVVKVKPREYKTVVKERPTIIKYGTPIEMNHNSVLSDPVEKRIIWIDPPGKLQDRFDAYSQEISQQSNQIWQQSPKSIRKQWTDMEPWNYYVIDPNQPDYFTFMVRVNITTVFLKFALHEDENAPDWDFKTYDSNLVVHKYHEFAVDPDLCPLIHFRDHFSKYFNWMPYCSTKRDVVVPNGKLHVDLLDPRGYISGANGFSPFPKKAPPYVTYMSFMPDVILGENGSVVYNYFVIYGQASNEIDKKYMVPRDYHRAVEYDEVLSIAQIYPINVFHVTVDSLQRIVPYIKLLKDHPDIKIHVGTQLNEFTEKMLEMLGFSRSRIIRGAAKVKKLYLPEGSTRGFAHAQSMQLLSQHYRSLLKENKYPERRSVIFIRRTSKRYFINELEVERMVEKIAQVHGLKYELFPDDPSPPVKMAMKMFNRAVLVVAPHGAGLYNMIFSEPGTYFIEVFCRRMLVFTSLRLAHILGHRFYAHYGTKNRGLECKEGMEVDLKSMRHLVEYYMSNAVKLAK